MNDQETRTKRLKDAYLLSPKPRVLGPVPNPRQVA
jgi:hypothetical protein